MRPCTTAWAHSAAWLHLFGALKLVHERRLALALHLLVGARPSHLVRRGTHHHARSACYVLLGGHVRVLLHELLLVVYVALVVRVERGASVRGGGHRGLLAELGQLGVRARHGGVAHAVGPQLWQVLPVVLVSGCHRARTSCIHGILVVSATTHWSICVHVDPLELAVVCVGHHLVLWIG